MNTHPYPGLLISFEGIDGSGKSTQATMFFHRLLKEGYNALLVREPGGTSISEKIRDMLLDIRHQDMASVTELLLYAASRAQLVEEKIRPNLEQGVIVICDRYIDSTLAYQGYGRGINLDFIRNLNALATSEIYPDLTFIVDVDLSVARARTEHKGNHDRLEAEKQPFKARVQEGYYNIAESDATRIRIVSGEQDIDKMNDRIWELTVPNLELLKKRLK